jgi:hypothetical protein
LNDLRVLRHLLSELPLSDEQLAPVAGVVNRIEEALLSTAAITARMQSAEQSVDARYFKRGEPCPLCHHNSKHSQTCYLRSSTGWDLLAEHEATLNENDELRHALAQHLPHNGKMVLSGGQYKSLKARARARH